MTEQTLAHRLEQRGQDFRVARACVDVVLRSDS
jgi:hypothetical protein